MSSLPRDGSEAPLWERLQPRNTLRRHPVGMASSWRLTSALRSPTLYAAFPGDLCLSAALWRDLASAINERVA